MRLPDRRLEEAEVALREAELREVRDHLPVVEDADDDALEPALLAGVGDGEDRDAEPDRRPVDLPLDEPVLAALALEPVHAVRLVLDDGEERLGVGDLLGVPAVELAVDPEVDARAALGVGEDVDVARPAADALDERGLEEVDEGGLADLGLELLLVHEVAGRFEPEVERELALLDPLEVLVPERLALGDEPAHERFRGVLERGVREAEVLEEGLDGGPRRVEADEGPPLRRGVIRDGEEVEVAHRAPLRLAELGADAADAPERVVLGDLRRLEREDLRGGGVDGLAVHPLLVREHAPELGPPRRRERLPARPHPFHDFDAHGLVEEERDHDAVVEVEEREAGERGVVGTDRGRHSKRPVAGREGLVAARVRRHGRSGGWGREYRRMRASR